MDTSAEKLAALLIAERPDATPVQVVAWLSERHLLDPDYVDRYLGDREPTNDDQDW